MNSSTYDKGMLQSTFNNKKSYAAFLIDRPFNEEDNLKALLMNCLRYRLQIVRNSETSTGGNTNETDFEDFEKEFGAIDLHSPSSFNSLITTEDNKKATNSKVTSLYDTLLQLIDEFDATGIIEIFRLLLERRAAIPLLVPKSKKHYLSLLRHVTLPRIDNIRLSEDKSLSRVAVISCRQRNVSQTCDILKSIFNIDSFHLLDLATSNISSESMLAEIGCGYVPIEKDNKKVAKNVVSDGSKKNPNVLVVHVIGDFKPLWSFLRRFADCFLIEDSTVESESFFTSFMTEDKKRELDSQDALLGVEMHMSISCLWKPSIGTATTEDRLVNGFRHLYLQNQLSETFKNKLKSAIVYCMDKTLTSNIDFAKKRLKLCDVPILKAEGYNSLECVSPNETESSINKSVIGSLGNVRKNEFVLQKSFMQEAKHHESEMENRLKEDKLHEEEGKIKVIRKQRRADTRQVKTNSLLRLFLSLLETQDSCSRVLSIRVLEKELAKRGEIELGALFEEVKSLSVSYRDKLLSNADETDLHSVAKNLRSAKTNLIENVLGIEHLWRELSHLYVDMEPERRSLAIKNIPRLAAQHLMDGFCLELLDGDSNIIRLEWLKEVLQQLGSLTEGKGIFVLSVMGVQSSGKSTLLNTMFGIRMRTSVGQCTRGVNMQLLAVEGRPEYDYILLLDTEGTRSSEYHGLPGSEKRDNQMATLSILLSDATIVIMPGENDAAVKEILPIVLMAYQGSKLAEDNGGRLSSRMFFIYNRIDTNQKDKLANIVQNLGTSLYEAFSQVQTLTGNSTNLKSESPFADFKFDTPDSSDSDVRILGNVKKHSKPPSDVPDEEYGQGLIQFREHIHQRVTKAGSEIWKSRTISEFSSYIENVWKCIISANFIFTFATVVEHSTFDKLDLEYKKIERKLAEAYENAFKNIKEEMTKRIGEKDDPLCSITSMRGPADGETPENKKNSSVTFEHFESKLFDELLPVEKELNIEVENMLQNEGLEKWSLQFRKKWENNKEVQAWNWKHNARNAFDRLFKYENRVATYTKKMRTAINQLFKSSTNSWTEEEKENKFNELFTDILAEAEKEFPPKEVRKEITKVYQESTTIKSRKIEMKWGVDEPIETNQSKEEEDKKSNWISKLKIQWQWVTKIFNKSKMKKEKEEEEFYKCAASVYDAVHRIAAGKLCYDASIISNVIREVDSTITAHKLTENTVATIMHNHGMRLIFNLMKKTEKEWEKQNSVPAKLKSNKAILRNYFMMVSQGVEKTQLFAATMANTLENVILSAFEKEMVQKTFQGIRKERWLYDARFMQKHMDLHLIDLLEKKKLKEALDNIRFPKTFYVEVLHRLIAQKVPNAEDEWQSFKNYLSQAIERAALAIEVNFGRAQTFVSQLRKEFFEGYLKSETLGSAFLIDCSGEYEDCDKEENKEFQKACTQKLHEVLKKQPAIKNQEDYAKELSPKVVQYMVTLNDQAALPRCDECCRLCKSLCLEAANHDILFISHDAVHQPGGIAGFSYEGTNELVETTCCQSYEQGRSFSLGEDKTKWHKFTDYSKVFPGWKNPRIFEELPVREYILATYNKEIAEKYSHKPSTKIPERYSRNLSSIKEQLEGDIAGTKSN